MAFTDRLALAGLLLGIAAAPVAAVEVVASIKPIHSLVAGVMEGAGAPSLLVDGAQSPHTFALRPSDARRLAAADVVVWVGPTLESALAKPIGALARKAAIVTLSASADLSVLAARSGGGWSGDGHAHGNDHGHDHGHSHVAGEDDGHLWLDPANAQAILSVVAEALAGRDPARADLYRANAARRSAAIAALDASLRQRLDPVADRPFLVFHDAYQYLERRYGLNAVGAIAVSPDRKPGARRIRELRRRVAGADVRCVFSEPQFDPTVVATVLEGTGARTAVLDPLGAAIANGPELYPTLMRMIAGTIVGCLAPPA
ncbi:MAG: zinc ABC transporter substrate-binding protein [Alphaproteobacteria bacterium]